MRKRTTIGTLAALLSFVIAFAAAEGAESSKEISCSGIVVDESEAPVAGARVAAYRQVISERGPEVTFLAEARTDAEGAFTIKAAPDQKEAPDSAVVVATKEGCALALEEWVLKGDLTDVVLMLGKPFSVGGTVTDPAGTPIAGAAVRVAVTAGDMYGPHVFFGTGAADFLSTKTDKDGKFTVGGLPEDALVELVVTSSGRATADVTQTKEGGRPRQLTAGRTDVKVVLPGESKIEGTVTNRQSGQILAGVTVIARRADGGAFAATGESGADGSFVIGALAEGDYAVTVARADQEMSKGIVVPAAVTLEAEKTASNVKLEVVPPAVLAILVTDMNTKAPLERPFVEIVPKGSRERMRKGTEKEGIVSFQLAPGEYVVKSVYAEGYEPLHSNEIANVVAGTVAEAHFELRKLALIQGTVLDNEGKPAEGAVLRIEPFGMWDQVKEGSGGKFAIPWNGGSAATSTSYIAPVLYVIATLDERGLAAVTEMKDPAEPVEVRLAPAAIVKGRVVTKAGKPAAGASVEVVLSRAGWTWTVGDAAAITGDDGRYEVRLVPPGQEYVIKAADAVEGNGELSASVPEGSTEFAAKDVALVPNDLSVSGVVVDATGAPVEGAQVVVTATRRASTATTDASGKFSVDRLPPGALGISAAVADRKLYGEASAGAGATDVRITLSEVKEGAPGPSGEPASIVGMPLSRVDFLQVTGSEPPLAGKCVLVLVWDADGRPSRHAARVLVVRAEALSARGVVVIAVDTSSADDASRAETMKSLGITFPVRPLTPEERKNLPAFGIDSLPYIFITDAGHTVRAANVSLDELDSKLDEIQKSPEAAAPKPAGK